MEETQHGGLLFRQGNFLPKLPPKPPWSALEYKRTQQEYKRNSTWTSKAVDWHNLSKCLAKVQTDSNKWSHFLLKI